MPIKWWIEEASQISWQNSKVTVNPMSCSMFLSQLVHVARKRNLPQNQIGWLMSRKINPINLCIICSCKQEATLQKFTYTMTGSRRRTKTIRFSIGSCITPLILSLDESKRVYRNADADNGGGQKMMTMVFFSLF